MSHPPSPRKKPTLHHELHNTKPKPEDNNNKNNKFSARQQARTFIAWYKQMIDYDRQNLILYISDDVVLEWFGRTIKNRKKVSTFLRFDMQFSRHDFTSIDSIDKIKTRDDTLKRKESPVLANPLYSPEIRGKKRLLRSNCNSPEWGKECQPDVENRCTDNKKLKVNHDEPMVIGRKNVCEISHNGDGIIDRRSKRKYVTITPPNHEVGQGDCLPSTSNINLICHEALNAQLPKLAVECSGFIEFEKTRNNRGTSMKWERKCKMQISYSEDPLNVGEYIIWAMRYTDESKCRRNLLAEFERVANESENNKCLQT